MNKIDRFLVKNRMTIKAFTLAEILITLGIVGIVAAMTMPSIITNIQEKHFRSSAKKAFSTATQVVQKMNIDDNYQYNEYYYNLKDELTNHFKPYFNDCKITKINGLHKNIKTLDGNNTANFPYLSYELNAADGVTYSFYKQYHSGYEANLPLGVANGYVIYIIADVNGEKKPNTLGKDVFIFQRKQDGRLLPMGALSTYYSPASEFCNREISNNTNGIGCMAKVVNNEKY